MAKMNIYIADELKERMDGYGMKWSQIASSAFESAMNLEDRMEVDMEEASLERLRKSRDTTIERRHADAVAAGKLWALEHAEFDELAAIAAIDTDGLDDSSEPRIWESALADALWGEGEWLRQDAAAFFEAALHRPHPLAAEVRGFIEGAVEVYEQV